MPDFERWLLYPQWRSSLEALGYRLAGPRLTHRGAAEVVTEGIAFGNIQVPPHGNPIVMLADRQTRLAEQSKGQEQPKGVTLPQAAPPHKEGQKQ